jgi:hypothetical protein
MMAGMVEGGRVFFFVNKKEAKKTLISTMEHRPGHIELTKFFLLLFCSKKRRLFPSFFLGKDGLLRVTRMRAAHDARNDDWGVRLGCLGGR